MKIIKNQAGAERIELPSTVLETAILPLNHAPMVGGTKAPPFLFY